MLATAIQFPLFWLYCITLMATLLSVLVLISILVRTANDRGRTLKEIKDYIDAYDITKQSLMAQLRRLKQEASENMDEVLHGNTGIGCVWRERQRQQLPATAGVPWTGEGYTKEHDDEYIGGELVDAGISYAIADQFLVDATEESLKEGNDAIRKDQWPVEWDANHFKPKRDKYRNLERAAALLIAEIDRRIREDERAAQQPINDVNKRLFIAGVVEAIRKTQAEFDALPSSVAMYPPPNRADTYTTTDAEKDPANYIEFQPDMWVKAVVYKNAVQKILDDPRRAMPEAWEQGYRQRLVDALNGSQTLNPNPNPYNTLRNDNKQWCDYENGYNIASLVLGNLFVTDK